MTTIGYQQIGQGSQRVLILNDWMSDTSTWDGAHPYLNTKAYSWVFGDLRGYGRSKDLPGRFDLVEAATDALNLADALQWERFSIVGHSMSSLVALHLAQHFPERLDRAAVLTPPPPTGMGADEDTLAFLEMLALGDDDCRIENLKKMWGERLSDRWTTHKAERWRATATPSAAAAYVKMFAKGGLPEPSMQIEIPILAVTGEQDAEFMRSEATSKQLDPICRDLNIVPFAQCGHYPMQEMPVLLLATLERFFR